MIALATKAAELAARSSVARFALVHLTTYSEHDGGAISREFWWSTKPCRYKWAGGAAREFEPIVLSLSPIDYALAHPPASDRVESRRSQVRIVLAHEDRGAGWLWTVLGAENLQFARVEIADLLVDAGRIQAGAGTAWWDLTDYAGTEHVVRFRGELMEVPSEGVTEEEINLIFQADEPNLVLPQAEQAGVTDPLALGNVYPLPFGKAKNVRCVNSDFGWVTTLAQDITSGHTGATSVTDARKFPLSGSFEVQIGDERISASRTNDTTLNIGARAQSGTTAAAHVAGDPVAELRTNVVLIASGLAAKAFNRLYVVKPATRERVLVPSSKYSVDLTDDTTHPGRIVTSVTITAANYADLYELAGTTPGTRLAFEADVDGAMVPSGIAYSEGYGFEDGDFWQTFQCSFADVGTDVELTVAADALLTDGATVLGGCNSTLGWTVTGTATADTTLKTEGSASLKLKPNSNGQTARLRWAYTNPQDVSDRIIAIDLRVDLPTPDATDPKIDIKVQFSSQSSADPTSGKAYWYFNNSGFTPGEFRTVYFDMETFAGGTNVGFDRTTLRNLYVEVNLHGTDSDNTVWVDNIRFVTGTALAQRNVPASPVLNLSSYQDRYRLRVTATDVENIEFIKVYLSDSVTSGPTATLLFPHSFVIPGGELTENTLSTVEVVGSGGFASDRSAVRTLRIEIKLYTPGVGSVVTLHGIDIASETTSTWGIAAGTLIEEGPDVIRYFLEVLCGLTIEASSFSTAKTNLGGALFAGTYDSLGRDFGEILAALEYETRTNVVRVEKAGGTEYRALNAAFATSVYSYPAAVAVLANLRRFTESVRSALRSPSRFVYHYNPAPGSLVRTDAGFLDILRASIEQNDLTGSPDRVPTAALEAAEAAVGRRDAEPEFLLAATVAATAQNIAGFYVHEALRAAARRFGFSVPLYDASGAAYALEVGDVVELTPRWRIAPAKVRVVQVSHQLTEPLVGLVGEEVL